MRFSSFVLIIVCSLLSVSCSDNKSSIAIKSADRVFHNAKIYTLESSEPWAEAIAISGDEIVYVGSNTGVQAWIGEATNQQDLKGKMLLPGFIDSHAHPLSGGAYVRSLSLDTYSNEKSWLKEVHQYALQNPNQQILFGYGFLASAFGANGPTSEMLDSVVPDRAVILMDEGFHGAWANTKAMQLLGITKDTPDPVPGFSFYKKNENGEPTGYLLEATAAMAIDKLQIITEQSVSEGTRDVFEILNRYGVTAVFDAGALDVASLQMKVLDKIDKQGAMSVRLIGSHIVADVESMENAVAETADKKATSKHELYHINTLKIMNDGTVEGKTAGMFEDYQGEPGNSGETVFTQEQLTLLVSQAASDDIDIHIHALGERTIFETLNAIEASQQKYPNSASRYTICHLQVMTDKSIQRMAKLNVIAQSTPLWASYDEYGKEFVSEDQFNRYFRFNSLKNAGVRLSFGSDFPATGAGALGMSPLFNIEIGHTRQSAGKPNALVQPNENERLDIASLIKGYTLDAAYQLHMENEIGSIKVGKKADLIVLENNPFEVDPYAINKIEVLETIMGGKTVYSKP